MRRGDDSVFNVRYAGQDVEEFLQEYERRRANSVTLEGSRKGDINWLPRFPRLWRVVSSSPLRDDSPIWRVAGLKQALLDNGSKMPAAIDSCADLESLQISWRPAMHTASGHPCLESLLIWSYKAPDLDWLQPGAALRRLQLLGVRRSPSSLGEAVDLSAITYLGLESLTVTGLPGLRSAGSLTDLVLANVSLTPESKTELLSALPDLTALRRIALWRPSGLTLSEVQDRVPDGVAVVQADL